MRINHTQPCCPVCGRTTECACDEGYWSAEEAQEASTGPTPRPSGLDKANVPFTVLSIALLAFLLLWTYGQVVQDALSPEARSDAAMQAERAQQDRERVSSR